MALGTADAGEAVCEHPTPVKRLQGTRHDWPERAVPLGVAGVIDVEEALRVVGEEPP